jgi:hypothetical protein
MRLHRFAIDETKNGRDSRLINWRGFVTAYRDDETQIADAHVQVVLGKPQPEFSARFHVGTRSSETPWDGHLTVLGSGFYWGLGAGRALAHNLTRNWLSRCNEQYHDWEGRDLSISLFSGRIHWRLWTHPSTWRRGEFGRWREHSFHANPLDVLFGPARYWYEDIDTAQLDIELPEGTYPVIATLQRQSHGRPKLKRRRLAWHVAVKAPQGIPNRYDHSGGWKGDRVHGFGVKLAEQRRDWPVDARAAIASRILADRARTGFRKPQEVV